MLIIKQKDKIKISQFLAYEGQWDIHTEIVKTKNKVYVKINLRLPFGKKNKFGGYSIKDIPIVQIKFPSIEHIFRWGKLIMQMAAKLEKEI